MVVPAWFLALWGTAAAAYLSLCIAIWRAGSWRRWGSLLLIGADRVLFFLVSQILRHHYEAYFYLYWADAAVLALLQIGVVVQVFRDMPASRFLPDNIRFWTPFAAATVGLVVGTMTSPDAGYTSERLAILMNRSGQFALGAAACCLIAGLFITGFGLSRTGMRVTIGALCRSYSAVLLAYLTSLFSDPTAKPAIHFVNTADTTISLCVALWWTYAIVTEETVRREDSTAWAEHGERILHELKT